MARGEQSHMREFWDARAREDAQYFIYNPLPYRGEADEEFWASGERDLDALFEATGVELAPTDDVVEIGCGIGRMTRPIRARAATVRALDVSAEMIERAREENAGIEGIEWIVGDGVSLRPLPDASADAVISYIVFQHLPDPEITFGYIAEIGRVLRPAGWSAFQISNDPGVHRPHRRKLLDRIVWRLRTLLGRAPKGQADRAWLGSAIDLDVLHSRADAAGMDVEHVAGEGSLFCVVRVRRRRTAQASAGAVSADSSALRSST